MKKTRLYKNVSLWLLAVLISCLVLSGQSGIAQDEDIPPEIIYYDYVDEHGVLKGGSIKVYTDDPLHSRYEGAKRVFRESSQQFNVETIIDNGDPNNRVDLVILGDGYDVNDINDGIYKSHVNSIIHRLFLIDGFFSQSPFDEYAPFFNVHRVDVNSVDSGVSYDPCDCNCPRNTALGMRFHSDPNLRRLLYIGNEPNAYAAADLAPDSDAILAFGNTETYGGSGKYYSNQEGLACLAGGNQWRVELGLHEFGHSFADLGDEYFDPNGEVYAGDGSDLDLKANTSILEAEDMNKAGEKGEKEGKWFRWLDWGPEPKDVWTRPGAFVWNWTIDKFVDYNDGVYRPTEWSMMRALRDDNDVPYPFYQVNSEQFIFKIYELVNPIDYATPGGTYAIGTQFFVQPVKPAAHSLDVQWYLNDDPIDGATGTEFDSSTLDLPAGRYTLKVQVIDNTEMVRDEGKRDTDMNEVRTWTLGEAGHWKFDEGIGDTAYDSIGDNDGTLGWQVGADPCDPNWVNDPNRGWCLDFDGDDDYVSLSDMNALADNSTTVAAWIKAENLIETYYPIVSTYHNDGSDHGYLLYVKENPSSEYRPRFYIATGAGVAVESDISINTNKWYHIAGTFDGIKLKVYVDGEFQTAIANGYTGYYEDYDTTYIGYEDNIPGEGSVYFDGEIDDVRVYDWAMDQARIWEIMCTDKSKFIIKDNSSVLMAWGDDSGNLFLRGSLEQGEGDPPSITYNDGFKFKNSSDANLAMIDAINGSMYIKGLLQPQWKDPCDVINNFIIKDSNDNTVAYIDDPNGDLYLKGKLFDDPD